MNQRFGKQILVSFFTLTFLSTCGYGFYFSFIKPKPNCFDKKLNQTETEIDCGGKCHSCEINHLQPLEFSTTAQYVIQNNKYFIYSRVLNINQSYGAKNFKYNFLVTLSNGQTKSFTGIDYVLPQSGKDILVTNIDLPLTPTSISFSVDLSSVEWSEPIVPNLLKNPFSFSNISLKKGDTLSSAKTIDQNKIYYNFTKTLKQGSKGEEVSNLQSILLSDELVVSKVANLSISGTFDLNTFKAVIVWQKNNGISPQTGVVSGTTLDKLNELYGRPSNDPSVHQISFNFTKTLKLNMIDAEVGDLQRALASDPTLYPEAQITNKYGALTKRAVERFQTKYNIKVTGIVDAATRSTLNTVFNKTNTTTNNAISGVNVFIEGLVFNNTPIKWKAVSILGFICDTNSNVVGISKTVLNNVTAKSQQKFFLSWTHSLPSDLKICSDGLTIDTNTMDKANWVK